MRNEKVTGRPIGNLLYTVEDESSTKKTTGELAVPDPKPEKALGILNGVTPKPQSEDKPDNESQPS